MIKSSAVQEIIGTLSTELREKVEELVDYEEIIEETQASIVTLKRDIKRIKVALEALTGNDIPLRVDLDPSLPSPSLARSEPVEALEKLPAIPVALPPPPAVYAPPAPVCSACGGEMYLATTTMPKSGRMVSMLICGDCKNEKPLGLVG